MIDLETLGAVKTILVHGGGCPDGIASAILLHDALPSAKVRFIQYNSPEHENLEPEPNMLFADFTPKEARLQEFVRAGAIVLDHHKGAKTIVAAFEDNGRFGDEVTQPGVCGAMLCYRHVWQQMLSIPGRVSIDDDNRALHFAELAGIRDTWQRSSPDWTLACEQAEMLRFFPEEHWLRLERPFSDVHDALWADRRQLGKLLVERQARSVTRGLEKSWRFTSTKGTRVMMLEGTGLSSDASEATEDIDLLIGFGFAVEGGTQKMIFSCRSRVGYDVLGFAKSFGGGGHTAAAGFTQELLGRSLNPYQLGEVLVNEHEAKTQ